MFSKCFQPLQVKMHLKPLSWSWPLSCRWTPAVRLPHRCSSLWSVDKWQKDFFSPFLLSVQMQISTHNHCFKRQNLTGSSIIHKVHHLSLQLHGSLMKPFICVNVPSTKLTNFARYHILSLLYLICRLLWWISCSSGRKSSVNSTSQ